MLSALRQLRRHFQREFSKDCVLVLPFPNSYKLRDFTWGFQILPIKRFYVRIPNSYQLRDFTWGFQIPTIQNYCKIPASFILILQQWTNLTHRKNRLTFTNSVIYNYATLYTTNPTQIVLESLRWEVGDEKTEPWHGTGWFLPSGMSPPADWQTEGTLVNGTFTVC